MPLFASLTLVKETALKEAASLKSPLLTSFIEKELLHIDLRYLLRESRILQPRRNRT